MRLDSDLLLQQAHARSHVLQRLRKRAALLVQLGDGLSSDDRSLMLVLDLGKHLVLEAGDLVDQ